MKPKWTSLGALRPLAATLGVLVMTACGGGWGGSVGQMPEITGQPATQTVTMGQAANFTVTVTTKITCC